MSGGLKNEKTPEYIHCTVGADAHLIVMLLDLNQQLTAIDSVVWSLQLPPSPRAVQNTDIRNTAVLQLTVLHTVLSHACISTLINNLRQFIQRTSTRLHIHTGYSRIRMS